MSDRDRDEAAAVEPADAERSGSAGETGADGRGTSRRSRRHAKKEEGGSFLRELPFLLLVAFVLALLIKTFLVQAFFIPSGSMERTLQVRDRVLVNKLVYRLRDVHRGEIVVFNGLDSFTPEVRVPPPANALDAFRRRLVNLLGLGQPGERDYIKRVIGLPGDTVACCTDGKVTVNGVALDEPYLHEDDHRRFGPITVPPGRVWVMGDHRSHSSDSRINGPVPTNRIVGRAFVVVWPRSHVKGLRVPRQIEDAKVPPGSGTPVPTGTPVPSTSATPAALPALGWAVASSPVALGLAGAVPLALLRRRLRARRARRRAK